jgi:hypothetical protein
MKQTWGKEKLTSCQHDVTGSGNDRQLEVNGESRNTLTDANIETKLKKTFKSSFNAANAGFIAWCILVAVTFLCLALAMLTGIRWIAFAGAGFLVLAAVGIVFAFMAQTANQIVRLVAKLKGKDRDFFREEEKECSLPKAAGECYSFVRRVFCRDRNQTTRDYSHYELKYSRNQHLRNNARSYRSAQRPAFASSSGGGGEEPGESDSSDPPGAPHYTALKPSKPAQTFHGKSNQSNSLSRPWRFSRAFGCWCLPSCQRNPRRWAV